MSTGTTKTFFAVKNYDLALTLNSGQVFRWTPDDSGGWVSVVGRHWVRLQAQPSSIAAEVAHPVRDWGWLAEYLQVGVDLDEVLSTFPADRPMRAAVAACYGLRLLRQDPWECLASFILSSNNQITRIRQLIGVLCKCYGEPVQVPDGYPPSYAFPPAETIASLTEHELRRCKLGFRAAYLLRAARAVTRGELDLDQIGSCSYETARAKLLTLPGVGPKIADCVLLFAYGFQSAFPIDVWVERALRTFYFHGSRPPLAQLRTFAREHFGPFAGYAQQYLYHYVRTRAPERPRAEAGQCEQGKPDQTVCIAHAPRRRRT